MAVKLDIINKSGAWFTYGDARFQGRDNLKEYLKDHPDIVEELAQKIRENADKLTSKPAKKGAKGAAVAAAPAPAPAPAAPAPSTAKIDITVEDEA